MAEPWPFGLRSLCAGFCGCERVFAMRLILFLQFYSSKASPVVRAGYAARRAGDREARAVGTALNSCKPRAISKSGLVVGGKPPTTISRLSPLAAPPALAFYLRIPMTQLLCCTHDCSNDQRMPLLNFRHFERQNQLEYRYLACGDGTSAKIVLNISPLFGLIK